MRLAAAILLSAIVACPVPASAQGRGAPARPAPAAPARPAEKEPPPEPPPQPYERDLLRLSEIVGALSFLRDLCGSPDAAQWPAQMRALLDVEGDTPGRRDRLAGAYNRGYRSYALTYRECTPSAAEASSRFLKEGDGLSRSIAGRYGG